MEGKRGTVAWVAWGLGGVPILASMLRALSALSGTNLVDPVPVIGTVARALRSMVVFEQAQTIAFSQQGVVFGLFLLIVVAWALQGLLMARVLDRIVESPRTFAVGAVALSGLMYAFLFVGVYSPLLFESYPAAQLALFFAVPVGTTAALVVSYNYYPWGYQQAVDVARRAAKLAKSRREEFHNGIESGLGPGAVGWVKRSDVTVEGYDPESDAFVFVDQCTDVKKKAQRLTRPQVYEEYTPDEHERRARRVKSRAESLDVNRAVDDVLSDVERQLVDRVEQTFEGIERSLSSVVGDILLFENLPQEYRSFEFSDGTKVVLQRSGDSIATQLADAVRQNTIDLTVLVDEADTLEAHLAEVQAYLDERAESILQPRERLLEELGDLEATLRGIGGQTGSVLWTVYVDGDGPVDSYTVATLRGRATDVRESFLDCAFDEAAANLDRAESDLGVLADGVEFFDGLFVPSLRNGDTDIYRRESDAVPDTVFESLSDAVANDYGASLTIRQDRIGVSYDAPSDATTGESTTSLDQSKTDEASDERGTIDGPTSLGPVGERPDGEYVEYLVEELVRSEPSNGHLEIDLDDLPHTVTDPSVVEAFERYVADSDYVTLGDGDDDTIVVEVTDGNRLGRLTDELRDEYDSWTIPTIKDNYE